MSTSPLRLSEFGLRVDVQLFDLRSGNRDVQPEVPAPPVGGTMIVPPEVFWAAFKALLEAVNEWLRQQNSPPPPPPPRPGLVVTGDDLTSPPEPFT